MTPAQFWSAVPIAIVIGLAGLSGVLAIFAVHGLLDTLTKTARSLFPPAPPDNVIDIDGFRVHDAADVRGLLDRMTVRQPESLEFKNFRTMQRVEEWPEDVSEMVH